MIELKNNRILLFISGLFLSIFLRIPSTASDTLDINGYNKIFYIVQKSPDTNQLSSISNRLRLHARCQLSSALSMHGSYDLIFKHQDNELYLQSSSLKASSFSEYRVSSIDYRLYPVKDNIIDRFGIFQNIDRLFMQYKAVYGDIFVGRQAVAWGSSKIINPTDVLLPYTFNELDTEERIGVDAVRLRLPAGDLSELDIGSVFGSNADSDENAYYVRSKFFICGTDIAFIAMDFRDHLLTGIDITGSIKEAGFWCENAYVFSDMFDNADRCKRNDYYRVSAGCDYNVNDKTFGFIELHYNEAGEYTEEKYILNYSKPAYIDGSVYLLSTYYIAPGITYKITPLIIISGYSLWNLLDDSVYITSSVEYNISEDMYISAGVYAGIGRSSSHQFASEFGMYPDMYFTSLKLYF
ncbi:MAG: hypothetical protein ABII23_04490 [bacterium]